MKLESEAISVKPEESLDDKNIQYTEHYINLMKLNSETRSLNIKKSWDQQNIPYRVHYKASLN